MNDAAGVNADITSGIKDDEVTAVKTGVTPQVSAVKGAKTGNAAPPKGGPASPASARPTAANGASRSKGVSGGRPKSSLASLPIRLLHDRILVRQDGDEGERRSTGGIVIPATAQVGKRLVWARVVGVGPNVRSVDADSRVLFEPDDRFEVEVQGEVYLMLRERDIHAVATEGVVEGSTGLYL